MSYCGSKMSVSSSVSSSVIGEKSRMKQFINAVQEYNKTKSEDTASILSRTLQLLGVSLDLNTFDPNSSVVAEFFVSLHEMMSNLDSRSPLVWFAVSVLQQGCRNQAAHRALIHTYQFLPILSRLLGDHLTRDKKRKLLTLMQELTYGINISWQISYLPHLLTTLTRWIETGDEGITSLSLGVLLNVCHKNLPVVYTLMRTINTKHFLRTVMAMKNPATEVQVCKLLIILEHFNGQVPKEDILNFVRVTFRTIVEAFESKDLIRLRHIVEFFLEIRNQKSRLDAVTLYDSYYEDVLRILDSVERSEERRQPENCDQNLECMALLFEFLHALVELRVPKLAVLHGRIVRMALGWVQTEIVSARALALLRSVAVQPDDVQAQAEQSEVLEPLASGLTVLLHIVDGAVPAGALLHTEHCTKLTALLQLLRVLVCNDSFQSRVFATLKQSSILRVFDVLLGTDEDAPMSMTPPKPSPASSGGGGGEQLHVKESFTSELNELYVNAVALVCSLATFSEQWEPVLARVLNHRQVHAILAHAFYSNTDADTKLLVFEMARVRNFPLAEIARIMCQIQPSTTLGGAGGAGVVAAAPTLAQHHYGGGSNAVAADTFYASAAAGLPLMCGSQIEQLDRIIQRLNDALAGNQLAAGIATSEVMELYEYKMAAIGHAERAAQASLEAANQHATHLQHRLAQMSTEVSRLHQLLFHAQQCHEEARHQLRVCEDNNASLSARLTKEQVRAKELAQQLVEKERSCDDQHAMTQLLEGKLAEAVHNQSFLSKKCEDQVNKNIALVKASAAIEGNVHTLKKALDEKTISLTRCGQQIDTLSAQLHELEELRKQQEETIAIRDKELADTHNELDERKRILDTITKLTRS